MAYRIEGMSESEVLEGLGEHARRAMPTLERFWGYYRNAPTSPPAAGQRPRASDLAQAQGLPERLLRSGREVVIENDIAWRIHAMVDFMFGRPIVIRSTAQDPALRSAIDRALARVLERSGGVSLLSEIALLGHVYGHVDLLIDAAEGLRALGARLARPGPSVAPPSERTLDEACALLRIEAIEPRRGVAFLDPDDYRTIRGYAIRARAATREGRRVERLELISGARWRSYRDGRRTGEREIWWTAGRVPIVHIQNLTQPLRYEGLGEVEPLIPLQDELNTRLTDRAHRLTMQSFRVYLAKGFDPGQALSIGPGSVIVADSPDATIEEFGGSTYDEGEDRHIGELREALDKASAVPPIAAGAVQAKFGNLSSGNALRIALMGVVAKTARKRVTYGAGLARAAEMVLSALDAAGVLPSAPGDRGIEIDWPETVPGETRTD